MSDSGVTADKRWKVPLGLALLFVAAVVGWALFSAGERDGAAGAEEEEGAFRAVESDPSQPARVAVPPPLATQSAGSRGAEGDATRGTIIRQKLPEPDAGDAGMSAGSKDAFEWRDPANQKMLGQRRWMATAPDAESQAIDEAIEASSPQRYPIDLQVRRLGVDLAGDVVDDCFASLRTRAPQASGRISVAFDLEADGVNARLANVEITANVNLDDPRFAGCITAELSRVSFRSAEQGTMRVEYPFFFDGPFVSHP